MFPFKITFCHTIKEEISIEQFEGLLAISKDLLSKKGASWFSKEGNCLKFENNFFRLSSNWNLMAYTDGGFIEVKRDSNNKTKIRYGLTFISVWIISAVFAGIIFASTKNIFSSLVAFSVLGFLSWLVSVIRHWRLFLLIKRSFVGY